MCELKFATFSCQKRRGHLADKRDSEYSLLLQNALEPAILLVRLQALILLRRIIVKKLQDRCFVIYVFCCEVLWMKLQGGCLCLANSV